MTTFLSTYAPISSNATYQAIMGAIDTHITSFGWVLTSDTGQTDPGAATLPSINTTSGYRVYKTNDGLTTIYLRIDYYRGGSAQPELKLTAGWSTDGAGTITGNKCTLVDLAPGNPGSTAQLAMAGASGWLTVTWACDFTNGSVMAFTIERGKDTSGADVATEFTLVTVNNQTWSQQTVPSSGTVPQQFTRIASAHPFSGSGSTVVGANTLVSPYIPIKETGGGNPGLGLCVFGTSDFTFNTSTNVTLYGVTHTYIICPGNNAMNNDSNYRGMFRYE